LRCNCGTGHSYCESDFRKFHEITFT